jgi:hypothetical protein
MTVDYKPLPPEKTAPRSALSQQHRELLECFVHHGPLPGTLTRDLYWDLHRLLYPALTGFFSSALSEICSARNVRQARKAARAALEHQAGLRRALAELRDLVGLAE